MSVVLEYGGELGGGVEGRGCLIVPLWNVAVWKLPRGLRCASNSLELLLQTLLQITFLTIINTMGAKLFFFFKGIKQELIICKYISIYKGLGAWHDQGINKCIDGSCIIA